MFWFGLTLAAMLGWGVEDIFLKKSARYDDAFLQYKIAVWLGLLMGAALPLLRYLSESGAPLCELVVSHWMLLFIPLAYALTMILSNIGLRYLEMSIMSPVENASGAFPMIFLIVYYLATGRISSVSEELSPLDIAGSAAIITGMTLLAVVQQKLFRNNEQLKNEDTRYRYGALALIFPLIFCMGDTIDTVVGSIMLDDRLSEGVGEIDLFRCYCLMFFTVGVAAYIFMAAKGHFYRIFQRGEEPKIAAGVCETAAYICYIYALARRPLLVAPLISSYCIISILLSRFWLKEKLRPSQYACIAVVVAGIVALGISEGLAE
ncbi:MAG: EamA family transporter [Victivallaceae bacterium]|nr:EamA family transporter [Victivallaceae bacterium]